MATMIEEQNPPVTLGERYVGAAGSSNLRLVEERPGPVNVLIAAGVVARGSDRESRVLGAALQRLITEWDRIDLPQRIPVQSVKEWMEALPLVQDGKRTRKDRGGKEQPIMTRDKKGAQMKRLEQQKVSDGAFNCALLRLAQNLPSRVLVRETLYRIALDWQIPNPDEAVAGAIVYWLASKCTRCKGTGTAHIGELVTTCDKCRGGLHAPVPGQSAGYRLCNYMDLCRSTWLGAMSETYKKIHSRG